MSSVDTPQYALEQSGLPPTSAETQAGVASTLNAQRVSFTQRIAALREHAERWGHHPGTGRPWHRAD
jgi:hypothetical protein